MSFAQKLLSLDVPKLDVLESIVDKGEKEIETDTFLLAAEKITDAPTLEEYHKARALLHKILDRTLDNELLGSKNERLIAQHEDYSGDPDLKPTLRLCEQVFRRGGWIDAPYGVADYFLNVLPPAWMGTGAFATGEPYSHNAAGRPVFLCFRHMNAEKGTAQARYCTVEELKSQFNQPDNRGIY